MVSDQPFLPSVLRAIRVQLYQEADRVDKALQQELVLSALVEALLTTNNGSSLAWTIQVVSDTLPFEYELAPLPEHPILPTDAWEVIQALLKQPAIAVAEPVFVKAYYA